MDIFGILCGALAIILAYVWVSAGVIINDPPPPPVAPVDPAVDNDSDLMEDGGTSRLDDDEDKDGYIPFDPYSTMDVMTDEDMEDIEDMRTIFNLNKEMRSIKYKHERKDWASHLDMLLKTKGFEQRFRMSHDDFEFLLEALGEAITVSYVKSTIQSTLIS